MNGRDRTEEDLESVARELRAFAALPPWERVLGVGKLILNTFFGADESAWHERRRNKDRSIRKLARRPDCPFGKSVLTEAVGVYVLVGRWPELRRCRRITPTHVGKTLSLAPAVAVPLLQAADRNGWNVRELAEETKRLRHAPAEPRGVPISSSDRRAELSAQRALRALERMRVELGSELSAGTTNRERLVSVCCSLEQEVSAMRQLLHRVPAPPAAPSAAPRASVTA